MHSLTYANIPAQASYRDIFLWYDVKSLHMLNVTSLVRGRMVVIRI